MDGALRLALTSGTRFIAGSSLDLNFEKDKYLLNGALTTNIDAFHTRSSSAYGEMPNGDYRDFPVNSARITRSGYLTEGAATGLIDPTDSSLFAGSGVATPYTETVLGVFDGAIRVASAGNDFDRL